MDPDYQQYIFKSPQLNLKHLAIPNIDVVAAALNKNINYTLHQTPTWLVLLCFITIAYLCHSCNWPVLCWIGQLRCCCCFACHN